MVDSLLNICRVCLLEQGEQELQSVFVSDESSGLNIHLAEMLMACASVQVNFGDGLPDQICKACAEKTVTLFLFKLKCEESDTKLRNQLGKSPLKEEFTPIPFDSDVNTPNSDIDVDRPESAGSELENEEKPSAVECIAPTNLPDGSQIQMKTDVDDSIKFFKCKLCPKVYNRSSYLLRHEKFHMNDQLFKCEICDKKFTRNDLLDRHKIAHAKKNNQEIDEDIFDGSLNEVLIKSEVVDDEHSIKPDDINGIKLEQENDGKADRLSCKICKKNFIKISRLKRHMKTHSAEKPFTCQTCCRGFSRPELYKNHMTIHTGIKPHVCNICNKGFNQISNLKDHMRTHNGEKPFLCSVCGKGFNQLGNLRQHSVRHTGIKAHICSMCGHGFASKGELSAHLRKHTGARPFVCSICQHGFTTSSSLTKHKRIHSGEKPYECDVCHMKFSRNGILSRHKRIHTGEKPYACKFCSKAFTQSNDLNSHLRIHTGEKPYICDQCGQAFRQSSALKSHKRTHIELKPLLKEEIEGKLKREECKSFLEARFDFETSTWTYIKKTEENV